MVIGAARQRHWNRTGWMHSCGRSCGVNSIETYICLWGWSVNIQGQGLSRWRTPTFHVSLMGGVLHSSVKKRVYHLWDWCKTVPTKWHVLLTGCLTCIVLLLDQIAKTSCSKISLHRSETGEYLALDLGGTNFRVLLITLKDGRMVDQVSLDFSLL